MERKHQLKDELTTEMHAEFMEGEMNAFEMRVFGAFAQINNGIPKKKAFERYKLTEKEYNDNIDRVLKL